MTVPTRPESRQMRAERETKQALEAWDEEITGALARARKILEQRNWRQSTKEHTIFSAFEVGKLAQINIDWIQSTTPLRLVDELIHDFHTEFFPVRDAGQFVGYVKAEKFRAILGQNQYSRDIFLRNENTVMEILENGLITVDARTTLPEVSRLLMARPKEQLYDPFVITYHGEYYGVATVKAVMDGKQAAILTPTTVLAYQHFESFKKRFAAFRPVGDRRNNCRTKNTAANHGSTRVAGRFGADLPAIRAKLDELGMYYEGNAALPATFHYGSPWRDADEPAGAGVGIEPVG